MRRFFFYCIMPAGRRVLRGRRWIKGDPMPRPMGDLCPE